MISAPSGTGVASPPVQRMFSTPTKMFTCGRTLPVSSVTRSRTPGWSAHSAASASPTVEGARSIATSAWPAVKVRRNPGIRKRTTSYLFFAFIARAFGFVPRRRAALAAPRTRVRFAARGRVLARAALVPPRAPFGSPTR